ISTSLDHAVRQHSEKHTILVGLDPTSLGPFYCSLEGQCAKEPGFGCFFTHIFHVFLRISIHILNLHNFGLLGDRKYIQLGRSLTRRSMRQRTRFWMLFYTYFPCFLADFHSYFKLAQLWTAWCTVVNSMGCGFV